MRKTLLLLLTLALGILGTGNNELFARPGYYKADPVLCNLGSKTDNSIFNANTIFSKFLKGIAVAPPDVQNCNPPIIKDADGTCSANVSWNVPFTTDGSSLAANYPQLASNPGVQIPGAASSGSFPVGTDTVIYRFTNADGVADCRIPITVQDVQAPTVTCGADINGTLDLGVCFASNVSITSPMIADNCTPVGMLELSFSFVDANEDTITGTIAPLTGMLTSYQFPVGTTSITWVVVDTSGTPTSGPISDTCVQNIVISDSEAPTMGAAPADDIRTNDAGECGSTWGYVSPTFNDNCPTNTNLTWTVYLESGATPGYQVLEDVTVEGNGSNSNVDDFFFPVGVHYIVYTVTDFSSNTATDMTMVTVTDNESPVITPSLPLVDFATSNDTPGDCSALVNITKPVANDNCDDNSLMTWAYTVFDANDVMVSGGADDVTNLTLAKGAYYVVYTVTDSKLNTSLADTAWFAVADDEDPEWQSALLADATYSTDPGICTHQQTLVSPNVLDNCGGVVLDWVILEGLTPVDSGSGATINHAFTTGISTVIWTATDNAGNFIADTVIITVNDTTKPVIDAGMDVTLYAGALSCDAVLPTRTIVYSDNCDVLSVETSAGIFDFNTGDFGGTFEVGINTIYFTATDVNGNLNYDTLVVTVLDTLDPGIRNYTNIVTSADANCEFVKTFDVFADFALPTPDNCTLDSIRYEIIENGSPAFDKTYSVNADALVYPFPKGTSNVTVTLTDASGNSSTDLFNVVVVDNTSPTTSGVTASITRYLGVDCDSVLVELILDASNVADNCSNDVYLLDNTTNNRTAEGDTATSYFTIGTHVVTWTIKDENPLNPVTTVSTTITVLDTIAPSDAPNDTLLVQADLDSCSGKVKVFAPVSLDSCGISSVQYSINGGPLVTGIKIDGPSFPVDTNIVEWFTTDNSNNTRIDTSVVIVIDTQNPVFDNANNYVLSTSDSTCVKDTTFNFMAIDNCGGIATSSYSYTYLNEDGDPETVIGTGTSIHFAFPTNAPTVISLTAEDTHGNDTTVTFTVTVIDTYAPTFTCPADTVKFVADSITCGKLIAVAGDNAVMGSAIFENCALDTILATYGAGIDFDPTAPKTFSEGATPVTVTVVDAAGNSTTCSFVILVEDKSGPIVSNFPTDTTIEALANECSHQYFWTEPTAIDACDDDNFTVSPHQPSGTIFKLGTTTVTYVFTDGSGNSTSKSFNVTVVDNQKPVINEMPTALTVALPSGNGNCTAAIVYDVKVQDNCDAQGVTITSDYPSGTYLAVGTYVNHITVKDSSGNQIDSSFVITVVDNTTPVITNAYTNIVSCVPVVQYDAAVVDDNCMDTVTYNFPSGSSFAVGTTTVIVTAKDKAGHVSTKSFDVTVISVGSAHAGVDTAFCVDNTNKTVNALTAPGAGETATWTNAAGAVVTNVNNQSSPVLINAAGTYEFTYTISNGPCKSEDKVVVTVNAPATSVSAGADQTVTGDVATLVGSPINGVWTKENGNPSVFDNANAASTQVSKLAEGNNKFTWTVTPAGCASSSDEVIITSEFAVATAFTPNSDGDNDSFEIPALAGHPDATIEIFNRWGASVFKSTGAEYAKKGWDGTFEGEILPVASYYYVIDFNDGSSVKKGYVSIIR